MLIVGPDAQLIVVVESKRSYGRIVADVAVELGCDLRQVNTVALNHYRDLKGPVSWYQWHQVLCICLTTTAIYHLWDSEDSSSHAFCNNT